MTKKTGCPQGQRFIDGKCVSESDIKAKSLEYFHSHHVPIKWDELGYENRAKLIDDIVKKHSYARVISHGKKDLLDAFTAQHIKLIKDNLSKPDLKKKFLNRSLYGVVDITWKLIEKQEAKK